MKNLGKPFLKFPEELYSLLRIMAGTLFMFHGVQKVLGLLADPNMMPQVGSQLWFGGVLELVCGLLILAGFITPIAAFIASGEMAVAYFQFHWRFSGGNNFFPVVNHGELAVLYCFLFLFICAKGGGKWSVDNSGLARRNQR